MGWMLDSLSKGSIPGYVFFWSEKGRNGCFSQWYKSDFTIGGHQYCCMEQYMMAQKAILFKDTDTLGKILSTTDPRTIKALGREVKEFNSITWGEHKSRIVFEGNLAKFSQNETIKDILLGTDTKVLVEASPYDNIWGIGLRASDATKTNPSDWKGQNLLGFALMQVRDELNNR